MKATYAIASLILASSAWAQDPSLTVEIPAGVYQQTDGFDFTVVTEEPGVSYEDLRVFVDQLDVTDYVTIHPLDVEGEEENVDHYTLDTRDLALSPGQQVRIGTLANTVFGERWSESASRVENNVAVSANSGGSEEFTYTLDVRYDDVEVFSESLHLWLNGVEVTKCLSVVGPIVIDEAYDPETGVFWSRSHRYYFDIDPYLTDLGLELQIGVFGFLPGGGFTFDYDSLIPTTAPWAFTDAQQAALNALVAAINAATPASPNITAIKAAGDAFQTAVGNMIVKDCRGTVNGETVIISIGQSASGSADHVISLGDNSPQGTNNSSDPRSNKNGGNANATNSKTGGTATAIGGDGGSGQSKGGKGGSATAKAKSRPNSVGKAVSVGGDGGRPQTNMVNGKGATSGGSSTRVDARGIEVGSSKKGDTKKEKGSPGTAGMPGTRGGGAFGVDTGSGARSGRCPNLPNA